MRGAFLKLHLSIFLAGFTGVFGKLIHVAEGPLTWYRMLITTVCFFLFLRLTGRFQVLPLKEALRIGGVGVLIGLHWLFFYGSIKYANISVGVVCFALVGFFTAVFDPLIHRRSIIWREIAFSLITLCGIALIFHFDTRYRTGIVLGVIGAALAALFTIATKAVGRKYPSTTMLWYEMAGGFLFLIWVLPAYARVFPEAAYIPDARDLLLLTILSVFCTIGMFLLQIQALQKISAFTVNLSYNLEPIYSIALAMLFFGEAGEVGASFFIGLALICVSVLLQTAGALRLRERFC